MIPNYFYIPVIRERGLCLLLLILGRFITGHNGSDAMGLLRLSQKRPCSLQEFFLDTPLWNPEPSHEKSNHSKSSMLCGGPGHIEWPSACRLVS